MGSRLDDAAWDLDPNRAYQNVGRSGGLAGLAGRLCPQDYCALRVLEHRGVIGDAGPSDLFTLQQALGNARADLDDARTHGTIEDAAAAQAIVDHLAQQVQDAEGDPTGAVAAQAVADNTKARLAYEAAVNADPEQTKGKTWLQWFAATPVATGIIRTGAFTAGATGVNAAAVKDAINKFDDPRLGAGGAFKTGQQVGSFTAGLVKALAAGAVLVGGYVLYSNVRRVKRIAVGA